MSKYYSVRVGRIPGIYLTWKECEEQVKGYSKAKYKKFELKEDAEKYMTGQIINNKKKDENIILEKNITQRELKKKVKEVIERIGLCESIKTEYPEDYLFFLELFTRHPNWLEKTENMKDVKIRNNKIYLNQKEVLIEKENGDLEDISVLNKCISGKETNNNLNIAMRNAIENQIQQFKKNNELKCEECGTNASLEVDHVNILFIELYENFLKDRTDIPNEFNNTISNSKCFKPENIKFEEEWKKYHETNAELRILCNKCNNKKENKLKREEKYSGLVNDNYNFENSINVYTDGSCINNGSENAIGGYGIYFEDEKKSISKKLKFKEGYNITNNRAEIKAILEVLKYFEKEKTSKEIIIHTDSMYCIQVLLGTNTYKKIEEGKEVPNSDYIKKCYKYIKRMSNIKLHHVLAHTNKQDIHSIGNDKADKLANEAIKKYIGKNKFNFGKYEGKTFEEIYNIDKNYFNWCINNNKKQIHDIKLFIDTMNNK
jgi:ribonuclease HI/viroplasmin and RNaseH domain-containing protein